LKQQGETDERADRPQTSTTIRQTIVRYSWLVALGFLVVVATLAMYDLNMPVPTPAVDRGQVSLVEPAAQSVLNYLRVHSSVQPAVAAAAPLDPAQQSVMQYVRAHESVKRSPALWDQAQQAVLDYLRAHSR